jgi:hypothetical protein
MQFIIRRAVKAHELKTAANSAVIKAVGPKIIILDTNQSE